MHINLNRGDLWYVDLGANKVGSEQGGLRPCVIIQNNVGNHHSPTTIVAVITSARKKKMPTHFILDKREGLQKKSLCLCEQILVVDKIRLKNYIGRLSDNKIQKLNQCLLISLGFDEKFNQI